MLWAAAWLSTQVTLLRKRGAHADRLSDPAWRRARALFITEHAALLAALASGYALMAARGFYLGHPRWLAVKIGLVVFLLVPLEGFHAYLCHAWIPAAQRVRGPSRERQIERGVGMEEMIRTLAIPLLGLAAPLLVWLSLAKPF